jgi:hypothetical protein
MINFSKIRHFKRMMKVRKKVYALAECALKNFMCMLIVRLKVLAHTQHAHKSKSILKIFNKVKTSKKVK